MFDSGLLVPVTQEPIHKQSEASRKGYYPPTFAETHKANEVKVYYLDIRNYIYNTFNVIKPCKVVVTEDVKVKELDEKVIKKFMEDYKPDIEEVYEKGIKIVSFESKK